MAKKNKRVLQTQESSVSTITVIVSKAPGLTPIIESIPVGLSLNEIFARYDLSKNHTSIVVNDSKQDSWDITPQDGDNVIITQLPSGAVVVFGLIAAAAAVTSGIIAYNLYKQKADIPEENKNERIRGVRNKIPRYDPVPVVLGKRRITPPYAALPYSYWVGDKQYYRILLCLGYGPLKVEDVRIGDVPINQFKDVKHSVLDWYENRDPSKITDVWSLDVKQTSFNEPIPRTQSLVTTAMPSPKIASSPEGEGDVSVTIAFPRGVVRYDSKGKRNNVGSLIRVQYQGVDGKQYLVCRYITFNDFQRNGALPGQVVKRDGMFYKTFNLTTPSRRYVEQKTKDVGQLVLINNNLLASDQQDRNIAIFSGSSVSEVNSILVWENHERFFVESLKFTPVNVSTAPITFRIQNMVPDDLSKITGVENYSVDAELLDITRSSEITQARLLEIIGGITNTGRKSDNFRPAVLAMDIKASDQISGMLDNVNVLATQVVPSWGQDWTNWWPLMQQNPSTFSPTQNPAHAYRWILQGPMNADPVRDEKINLADLQAWAMRNIFTFGVLSDGWRISQYVDYESELKTLLNNIASTGRAEFTVRDGKFTVVERIAQTVPRQLFTPKNSRDFSSVRDFPDVTDGIEFEFDNEDFNYEKDSDFYPDPFIPESQHIGKRDKIEFWGIPNGNLALRHARFAYFERKLRRETYELTTDIEGLVAQRGDMVRIANDTIDVGIGQGFITSINGNNFTIDETRELVVGSAYGVQVRTVSDGTKLRVFRATYNGNNQWTAMVALPSFKVGDLAVFGSPGREVLDALVMEVRYSNDYEAKLTLANMANDLFRIDSGFLPEYESGLTPRTENTIPTPPVIRISRGEMAYTQPNLRVMITNTDTVKGTTIAYRLQYAVTSDVDELIGEFDDASVKWNNGGTQSVSEPIFDIPVLRDFGNNYYFRAQSLGSGNLVSDWSTVEKIRISANPTSDVTNVFIKELIDEPKTPDGSKNTAVITITPPVDSTFLYAIVEYRGNVNQEFFLAGRVGTEFENEARFEAIADGRTYEIRVRSVSVWGVVNADGIIVNYRSTNTLNPNLDDTDPSNNLSVPNVTGLELFGQGNDTNFTGRDAKFRWNRSTALQWVNIGSEGLLGAESSKVDQFFKDFEVVIRNVDDNVVRRTEYVVDPYYVYTWEKNLEDSLTLGEQLPRRQFAIEVSNRSRQNRRSARPTRLVVQNPAPLLPAVTFYPLHNSLIIRYTQPSDPDWVGIHVWLSETEGFTPNNDSLVFDGSDTSLTIIDLIPGNTYYIRYQPYDAFGPGDMSDEQVAQTQRLLKRDLDDIPPTVPVITSVTSGVFDNQLYTRSWIKLEWEASEDVDGIVTLYLIEISESGEESPSQYATNDLEFIFTDAVPGRTYSIRIRAQDWAGNLSDWSTVETIVAEGDTTPPAQSTNISAVAGLDKVVLSWTNPSDEDFQALKIYRGTSSDFTPNDATNLVTTMPGKRNEECVFVDSNVVNGTNYWYRTKSVDVTGNESDATSASGPVTPFKLSDTNIANYFQEAAIGNAYIDSLDAVKITTGTLNADRIGANSITAAKINVSDLFAQNISATGTISGGIFQGGSYRSSDFAGRVELSSVGLRGFNASSVPIFSVDTNGSGFLGVGTGQISWDSNGAVQIPGVAIIGELIGLTIKTQETGTRIEMDSANFRLWDGTEINTAFRLNQNGSFHLGYTNQSHIAMDTNGTLTIAVNQIGAGASVGPNSVAFGASSKAIGDDSVAIGSNAQALASDCIAIGRNSGGTGARNVTIGKDTGTVRVDCVMIGNGTFCNANTSIAIGRSAEVGGLFTIVQNCVAVGDNAKAIGESTVALGVSTSASGASSIALGQNAQSSGGDAICIGRNSQAGGFASLAIGQGSQANNANSISIGNNTNANADNAISISSTSQLTIGTNSVRVGAESEAPFSNSNAIGTFAKSLGLESTSYGYFAQANANYASSFGSGSWASGGGQFGLALGYGSQAFANYATAVGSLAKAHHAQSVALGPDSQTTTSNQIRIGRGVDTVSIPGNLIVSGATKTFQMVHPTKENYYLRHGAYEGPVPYGTIYRYTVETVGGKAEVDLPEYFSSINVNAQVFPAPVKHFGSAYGEITGNKLEIFSNKDGIYNILIMAERGDVGVSSWNEFGAEVPMTDDEIEFHTSEKEGREPKMKGYDAYEINANEPCLKDKLTKDKSLKPEVLERLGKTCKMSKTVVDDIQRGE